MEIKKAIITAAGHTQRTLPLQSLVDGDGQAKTALRILIEEIRAAGIEEICVVICPGDQHAYAAAACEQGGRLCFVEQRQALGYGHAVFCARDFAAGKPFRLVVLDAVLTQQTVHPNPFWPVLRRGQIQAKAAPGISQQPVVFFEELGANRV